MALQCTGFLTEPDGCKVEVQLVNVSRSGFCIRSGAELMTGEQVYLDAPRCGPQRAKIIWTLGERAGGLFLDSAPVPI